MKETIKWVKNRMPASEDRQLRVMSLDHVAKARAFHNSFPQYSITPLARLDGMAEHLGLGGLFVKDESYRFGLNAFKVLGGSFAMARYIAQQMGRDVSEMTYDYLTSEAFRKEFGQATFFTATDGNHGRGVAWAANKLGQKAVVHMPKGSSRSRYDNIAKEGAKVTIEEVNYDDCVRMAAAEAAGTEHGVVVQDTAWEGYEEIPAWIMQGYGTMASEAAEQLRQLSVNRPTHVFVQAGVGSLAGAVVGYFVNRFPNDPPKFVVMEAGAADCLYQGALAGDGASRTVGGDLQTIMAGLACGEPCSIGWNIHLLGYPAQPCVRLCLLPGLGQRQGDADARRSCEGRSPGHLRRVRRGGHGPDRSADGGRRVPGAAGGYRSGPFQQGADVLHGGRHGPCQVPADPVGRRISHGLKIFCLKGRGTPRPFSICWTYLSQKRQKSRRSNAPPGLF